MERECMIDSGMAVQEQFEKKTDTAYLTKIL